MKTSQELKNAARNLVVYALCITSAANILADDDKLRDLGTNAAPGEIPKWDGSQWRNSHDDITTVVAGPGLIGNGTNTTVTLRVDIGGPGTNGTVASYYEMDATRPPIGAIVAWAVGIAGVPTNLPPGWVRCDGQALNDSSSPLNGRSLPNLNGVSGQAKRFLRGAAVAGSTGGTETHTHFVPSTGSYATTHSTSSPGWSGASSGSTSQSTGTLPSYYEVVWIMRIK